MLNCYTLFTLLTLLTLCCQHEERLYTNDVYPHTASLFNYSTQRSLVMTLTAMPENRSLQGLVTLVDCVTSWAKHLVEAQTPRPVIWVFSAVCLLIRTISQKSMQLRSRNLT